MFQINEDKSIYVTRGDAITISLTAMNGLEPYIFVVGDIVRLKVFEKKACHCVVLQKDIRVTEESEVVDIALSGEDTKFGELISKPTDYWYEVELNPESQPQTIVGYDEEGSKVFRLYPEGGDVE
jgi:hypothetical protein